MPSSTWPALEFETLPWQRTLTPGAMSRTQMQRQSATYEAAIPATIAELPLLLPNDVASAAEDAANEISRFDADMGGEIAPFTSMLLRSESAASSKIEKLTAS